jgi:hypothetical protein
MNKLASWCKRRNIKLTEKQREQKLPFFVRNIYSSYRTLEGRTFYVNSPKGDVFIHLNSNGGYVLDNGWDGGDYNKSDVVKNYYQNKDKPINVS